MASVLRVTSVDGPDDGSEAYSSTGGQMGGRAWWVAALLLLLLLALGIFAHLVFPTPRATEAAPRAYGVVPMFSVYGLNQPLGVSAGPEGQILVSDTGIQKVLLFDENGNFVRRIGGDEPSNKVFSVVGSLFARDRIYVCDWSMRRVWVFREDGTVETHFPDDPTAAVYGEEGLTPYGITEFDGDFLVTSRNGIYRFDGDTGALKGRFDRQGSLEDELLFPNGITVDEMGGVYVADTLNRRVVAYDSHGEPLWSLGQRDVDGEIKSFFGLPRGIAMTESGLLVSDAFHHTLYLLDLEGNPIGTYAQRGVVDGTLNFPEALAIAPDGFVYVADRENNRVQVLSLEEPEQLDDEHAQRKWRENYVRYTD